MDRFKGAKMLLLTFLAFTAHVGASQLAEKHQISAPQLFNSSEVAIKTQESSEMGEVSYNTTLNKQVFNNFYQHIRTVFDQFKKDSRASIDPNNNIRLGIDINTSVGNLLAENTLITSIYRGEDHYIVSFVGGGITLYDEKQLDATFQSDNYIISLNQNDTKGDSVRVSILDKRQATTPLSNHGLSLEQQVKEIEKQNKLLRKEKRQKIIDDFKSGKKKE